MESLLRFIIFATTESMYESYVQILLLTFAVTFSTRSNIIWSFESTKQGDTVKVEQAMTYTEWTIWKNIEGSDPTDSVSNWSYG
jgi:hypothetical protein